MWNLNSDEYILEGDVYEDWRDTGERFKREATPEEMELVNAFKLLQEHVAYRGIK